MCGRVSHGLHSAGGLDGRKAATARRRGGPRSPFHRPLADPERSAWEPFWRLRRDPLSPTDKLLVAISTKLLGVKKLLSFGLRGAVGCFLAALLGEGFLAASEFLRPKPPPRPPQALAIVVDCSGSMAGGKLEEVKAAAVQFAGRQDLARDSIAVVAFASGARVAVGLSHDKAAIEGALDGLESRGGTTEMDQGLEAAMAQLEGISSGRNILLFTDGEPDRRAPTIAAARACRDRGIRIVAVATDDANIAFLHRLTGDAAQVFWTDAGSYGAGFESAEKIIYRPPTIVESSRAASRETFASTLVRVGGWTALLALGICLSLLTAQNRLLRRRSLSVGQGAIAIPGSILAGLAAGAAGQLAFVGAARLPAFELVGRVVAWALMGTLLGLAMARFVPNLLARRGLLGGLLGGAVGGTGFVWLAAEVGDVAGRLAGAAALGLAIGSMIVLVEIARREAWLEVAYGKGETETVTLGAKPVRIGSDENRCTIWARDAAPVAVEFQVEQDRILCRDLVAGVDQSTRPGEQRKVGNITVTVCGRRS